MQTKFKYKLYGEFDDYEVNELVDWFKGEISKTPETTKSLKITIDWEPTGDAV